MANGIDISEWQGEIDWNSVDTDFVIIRAGYGRSASQVDARFEANYEGCKSHDIPCGAYWFSYAESEEDARLEAKACIDVIKDKKFEYPIYFDVEDTRTLSLGTDTVSSIIRIFLDTLEQAGYFAGLYMSKNILLSYTKPEIRERYAVWIADYDVSVPDYSGSYGMWQKSAEGRINGISGNVDLDEAYEDYPEIIKSAGLNGFDKPHTHTITVIIDGRTVIDNYYFS